MVLETGIKFAKNFVARDLKDLPPLKKGFIRVVHRTHPDNVESIVKDGLKARHDLAHTSDQYLEEEFWKMLARDPRGDAFGSAKIIMDIPYKEYNLLTRNSNAIYYNGKELAKLTPTQLQYGAHKLVCPSKYIVGAIEQKYPWGKKCIEIFKQMASKNPEREVVKTDLRMFNRFRRPNAFEEQQAEILKAKKQGEIASNDGDWGDGFD